jgi:hypothetical protein
MAAMPEPTVENRPSAAASSNRGQRLWAVLLVLDSFFVITFGGTLAMKLYQHSQAPAAPIPAPHGHRAPKAPAPAPAPESAPAKPAESPKPEAKSEPAEKGPRPPKPSMLHEAPQHEKAAPKMSGATAPSDAQTPAAPKGKALATEFTLKSPGAKSVDLVGAFIVHGGRKAMVSHPDGTWTLTLYLTPNTYRYWFSVNGKKTLDPQSAKIDRGASVVAVGRQP